MANPNSGKIVCTWASSSLLINFTSIIEEILSTARLGQHQIRFCSPRGYRFDLSNSRNYYANVIDLWMLSIMSFESMNFVQNWVRTGCLKFWWWFFFHSIHACCDVFGWNACWFLLYDVRSTCCHAWFVILDMLIFSGNLKMKILKIFIMFMTACVFPANFLRTFIPFPAEFDACSSLFSADYGLACI